MVIKILNLVDFDFGNYTLRIFQNGPDSLVYNFTISKDNEDAQEKENVGAAVGGSIAAFVVIAIIVIIIVYIIRKKPNIFKRNKEAKLQHNPTYSELSVSQSLRDRHTYETPIINESISPPDKEEEFNANYKNVTANDVKSDPFSATRSPNCNAEEANQDLFKENNNVRKDKEIIKESPYVEVE